MNNKLHQQELKRPLSPEQKREKERLKKEFLLYKERMAKEKENNKNNIHCTINKDSIVSLFATPGDLNVRTVLLCKIYDQVQQSSRVVNVDGGFEDKTELVWKENDKSLVMIDNVSFILVLSIHSDVDTEMLGTFLIGKYGDRFFNKNSGNTLIEEYDRINVNRENIEFLRAIDMQNMADYGIYQLFRSKYGVENARLNEMLNIRIIRGIKEFVAVGNKKIKNERQFKIIFDNHTILMFFLRQLRAYQQKIGDLYYQFRLLDPIKTNDIYEGTNEAYIDKQMNHTLNPSFFHNLSFRNKVHQQDGLLLPGALSFPGYTTALSNEENSITQMIEESFPTRLDKTPLMLGYNKYFMNIGVMRKQTLLYRVDYKEKIIILSDMKVSNKVKAESLLLLQKKGVSESSVAFIRSEKEKVRKKRGQSLITAFYNKGDDEEGGGGEDDGNLSPYKKIKIG